MNFFGVKRRYNFARENIFEGMLLMALPLLGIAILNAIPSLAKNMFSGWYLGSVAMASISASQTILGYLLGFSSALIVAANVVVAHACGKGDRDRISAAINTVLIISIVIGVILAAALMIFARHIVYSIGYAAEIIDDVVKYLRMSAVYVLFNTVLSALMGCMYAMGDSIRPLLIAVVQNAARIVLYMIAVVVMGMGTFGFAIADAFASIIGLALAVLFFALGKDEAKMSLSAGFSGKSLLFVLAIVITFGAQTFMINIGSVARTQIFADFGMVSLAAFSASNIVSSFVKNLMTAFSPVILTMVAQAGGAGNSKKAFGNAAAGIALSVIPGILVSLVLLVFGPFVMELFTSDYEVIDIAGSLVRLMVIAEFFGGVMLSVSAATRGRGATLTAFLTSGLSMFVISSIIGEMTYSSGYIMDNLIGYVVAALLSAICSIIGFVLVNVIAIAIEKPNYNAVPVYAAQAQNFDPMTGIPVQKTNNGYNFDPMTGKPIQKASSGYNFDPMTGKPLNQQNDVNNDNSQYIDKY